MVRKYRPFFIRKLVLVRELLLKTKIIFCTTKIVVYSSKLTKILLKRRIEPIKPIQIGIHLPVPIVSCTSRNPTRVRALAGRRAKRKETRL